MAQFEYRTDQEDPAYVVAWSDRDGNLIDFATGYTFTLKLVNVVTGVTALTKTTNITGAATAPNITVAWAAGELAIAAADYSVKLVATTGGRDRVFSPGLPDVIRIIAAPT